MSGASERLNKVLASAGLGSRRRVEALIQAGLVTVDGETVTDLGRRVDPSAQDIRVEGERVTPSAKLYYALHKPAGVLCTNAPEERRTRAIDLVPDPFAGRLFCVGRLDADSEGLLLLTNDGELTNRLTHPRYGVPKTYYVKLRGFVGGEALERARRGVHLAEGRTGPLQIEIRKRSRRFTTMLVTLREGKNRELRRIFAKLGFAVIEVKRVRIGPLTISGLARGACRRLRAEEVRALWGSAGPGEAGERPA